VRVAIAQRLRERRSRNRMTCGEHSRTQTPDTKVLAMKRSLLVLTAAAVALSPLAASAAPVATKRTVAFDYTGFSTAGAAGAGLNASGVLPVCDAADSCFDFKTVAGEKAVEIKASDPRVGIQVWYDGTYADTVAMFCGTAKLTVSPKGSHEIFVRTSASECGAVPTEGTLTATITGTK
jgi:hypothetical protein